MNASENEIGVSPSLLRSMSGNGNDGWVPMHAVVLWEVSSDRVSRYALHFCTLSMAREAANGA